MKSEYIFAFFTAILFSLAFPPFKYGFLAYWALVPFFYLLEGKNLKSSFYWGYVTGLLISLGTIYWISFVTLPGAIATLLIHPLYFSLYAMLHSFVRERLKERYVLAIPFIWTGIEYLKSLGELGFPWVSLGYTQSHYIYLIQYASYTSVFGVTFWVVMINVLIYLILKNIENRRKVVIYLSTILVLIITPWVYGKLVVPEEKNFEDALTVGLIQGNIDPFMKWKKENIEMSFAKYDRLSREAAKYHPDLLIWPETATPTYLLHNRQNFMRVKNLVQELNIPLVTGTPDYIFITRNEYKTFNSAVLITPGSSFIPKYDKMHLVPFGERVPYEDAIPFFKDFIQSLEMGEGNFSPGKKIVLFPLKQIHPATNHEFNQNTGFERTIQLATVICFESIFPDLVQKFVAKGAQLLIVITNDGWFGRAHFPWWLNGGLYQHARMSVFRAIENRISIARCANTGVSMFIDPYGRVLKQSAIFKDEYLVAPVTLRSTSTFFTRNGNVFSRGVSLVGLFFIFFAGVLKRHAG
ncbi:MAG: apolipoprotein N-acyltransferase [Calditrichaeota bacterium]|nr:MAG: apolipoprotein N-acyltransferase [Calditrichota bacterium]